MYTFACEIPLVSTFRVNCFCHDFTVVYL
jgi:hypothetical protein